MPSFLCLPQFADLSGEIEVGLSCYAGEAGNSPHSPFFIGKGILSQCGSSLLALRNASWENGMMISLSFLCGYPQVSCSIVLPKFLKWTPELSQGWVWLWIAILLLISVVGTEAGGSYVSILVMSLLKYVMIFTVRILTSSFLGF